MFDLDLSVVEKVLRAVLIYAFLVGAMRVIGRRELGQTNTLDFVVLLLVANAVQNGIIGDDITVTGAVLGATTLFVINEALTRAANWWPRLGRLIEGDPSVLIENGKPRPRALRRAGISLPELRAIARRQGFEDLDAVHTAILETNGVVTMFRADEPRRYHRTERTASP